MKTIEIDEQVYDYISKYAEPFVDSPNSVLRRLLLGNKETPHKAVRTQLVEQRPNEKTESGNSSEVFVNHILQKKFVGKFRVRSPFRMMFESDREIIYFQNFNKKGTTNLWFRLNKSPMDILRRSQKEAFVCLTNPAERFGFVLPLKEVDKKAKSANWSRDELEVNIDPADSRWRELSWNLEKYLYHAE